MKNMKYVPQRRWFFRRVAVLGGSCVLLPRTGGPAAGEMSSGTRSDARKKGYRLTPHIRKYYETLGSPAAMAAIETKE